MKLGLYKHYKGKYTKGKNKYSEEPSQPSKKEKILYKIMVVVTIIAFVAGLLIELFI